MKAIEWRDATVLIREECSPMGREKWRECRDYVQVAEAIRLGVAGDPEVVRLAAAMGIAAGIWNSKARTLEELDAEFETVCRLLVTGGEMDEKIDESVRTMRSTYRRFRPHGILQLRIALVIEALVMEAECLTEPEIQCEPARLPHLLADGPVAPHRVGSPFGQSR